MNDESAEPVVAMASTEVADDAGAEPEISAPTDPDAGSVDKPRRARRSRKSPDADATVQDAVAVADGESPARPKARGRRAKVAAPAEEPASQASEAIAVAAPEPVSVSAPPAERAEAEDAPRRARKQLPPDEIVVSSTSAEPDDAKPKKAGWWQRGFFGG